MAEYRKLFYLMLGILLMAAWSSTPLAAQEPAVQDIFTGHGIAKIASGDIETARQKALSDAQRKVIMEAVSALLPLEAMQSNCLLLKTNLFDKAATYLQSFKILSETTAVDTYQITIQGLIQQDLLRKELENMGLSVPLKGESGILLMLAEKDSDTPDYNYWWSSTGMPLKFPESELILKEKLQKRGLTIIDPGQVLKELPVAFYQNPEPDIDSVVRTGSQCSAWLVIKGTAEFTVNKGSNFSSLTSVQCNMKVQAIQARDRTAIITAASYALGVHSDESAAHRQAIEKACDQLLEQIVDKLQLPAPPAQEQVIRINISGLTQPQDFKQFVDSFKKAFPEFPAVETAGDKGHWQLRLKGPLESSLVVKRIFDQSLESFSVKITSTNGNILELLVTQREAKSESMNYAHEKQLHHRSEHQTPDNQ